jgi:hypothetical protein
MRIVRPRSTALATAVAALAIAGTAAPAQAADPALKLTATAFVALDPAASPGDHSGDSYLVLNLNADPAGSDTPWAAVTIDTSAIAGIATTQASSACTAAGAVLTCQVPLYQGHGQLDVQLVAVKDGKPGATGTVHTSAHFTSGNTTPATADTKVELGGTRTPTKTSPSPRGTRVRARGCARTTRSPPAPRPAPDRRQARPLPQRVTSPT